jgi:hypothetical protein
MSDRLNLAKAIEGSSSVSGDNSDLAGRAPMSESSYVVLLTDTDDPAPFKVFGAFNDANAFASSKVQDGAAGCAEIYLVQDTASPRAAIAAVQMGEGKFVIQRTRQPTSEEKQRELERAEARGPRAVLKLLGLLDS